MTATTPAPNDTIMLPDDTSTATQQGFSNCSGPETKVIQVVSHEDVA